MDLIDKRKRKSSSRKSFNNRDTLDIKNESDILGFEPLDIIDDLINSVHDSACDIVDDAEYRVSSKYPNYISDIQNGFDDFLDEWDPAIDKYCDKFELFALKNSFKVSPSIQNIIEEDKQRQKYDENTNLQNEYIQEHNNIDKEIYNNYQILYKEKCKNIYLQRTLEQMNNNIPSNLDDILLYLNNNCLSFDNIISSLTTLTCELDKLQNIHNEFQTEISKLPSSIPNQSSIINIEETFISHSKNTNIESISKLSEFTDSMTKELE